MSAFMPIYLLVYVAILLVLTFAGFARQNKKSGKNNVTSALLKHHFSVLYKIGAKPSRCYPAAFLSFYHK
jgi:hypothetical protein